MYFTFLFSWHFIEYQPQIISVLILSIFISQNIFMVFSFDFNRKIRAKPLRCRSLMLTLVSSNSFVYSVAATNWNCKPQRITLSATVAVNESEFSMIKKKYIFPLHKLAQRRNFATGYKIRKHETFQCKKYSMQRAIIIELGI